MPSRYVYLDVKDDPAPLISELERALNDPEVLPSSLELVFNVPSVSRLGVGTALKFRAAVEPFRDRCKRLCSAHTIRTPDRVTQMLVRGALALFRPVVSTKVVVRDSM